MTSHSVKLYEKLCVFESKKLYFFDFKKLYTFFVNTLLNCMFFCLRRKYVGNQRSEHERDSKRRLKQKTVREVQRYLYKLLRSLITVLGTKASKARSFLPSMQITVTGTASNDRAFRHNEATSKEDVSQPLEKHHRSL